MPQVVPLATIQEAVTAEGFSALVDAMAAAFTAYSAGKAVVCPVQHLGPFRDGASGDFCVKSGFVKGEAVFVVKIAGGGFKGHGSTGLMAAFSQTTGQLQGLLLDNGWLTDMRTAAAAALCARHFAPADPGCVGILGTGVQARFQLRGLRTVTRCRKVCVWGRRPAEVTRLEGDARKLGWQVEPVTSVAELLAKCRLVVTVTSATSPVLPDARQVQPGTTIVAVGSDGIGKQELAAEVTAAADLVLCDSLEQCRAFGELSFALKSGGLSHTSPKIREIGSALGDNAVLRGTNEDTRVIVCDLTGIAVQDVAAANLVITHLAATTVAKL
eukprot:m.116011 g.116011  ORF g.116011 m.116011 type:complete len:328 (+) comp13118_c0_seq3:244-1227(+)